MQRKAKHIVKQVLKGIKFPDQRLLLTGGKLHCSTIVATVLAKDRCLGQILQYNDTTGQWFMYEFKGPGIWSSCSDLIVNLAIIEVLTQSGVYYEVHSPSYIQNIRLGLQTSLSVCGFPNNPHDVFVFLNGVIDSDLRGPLMPHSPNPPCFTLLPYNYNDTATCPTFMKFIQSFTSGFEDRVQLIRAYMRCCLCSWTFVQKFLEVVGEGHTGKSVFQTVLTALVGFDNTVVTTLRDLNSNTFEIVNLQHKKLIVVSDTEMYTGPVGVLKQITGNDYLVGRRKHQQGAFNIYIEGMVLIVGNYPMYPRDATTGFLRRLIQMPATNVVKGSEERTLIIASPSGEFTGILSQELSGIFNWVMGMTQNDALNLIRDCNTLVPSLRDSVYRGSTGSNSISSWIDDELIPGEGMFVGGARTNESNMDMAYPTYTSYCDRNGLKPVSLKVFSTNVISIIRSNYEWKGFHDVNLKRKESGSFITGITRSPRVLNADYLRGGELQACKTAFPNMAAHTLIARVDDSPESERTLGPHNPRLRTQLRENYKSLLEESSSNKRFLRKDASRVNVPITIQDYVPSGSSEFYIRGVEAVLRRGLNKYKMRGPVVESYTNTGLSPRIQPYQYGSSYNSIKRQLRDQLITWSGNRLFEHNGYRMIDIDLVSCYQSILLGLFNSRLPRLEAAVKVGLWDYIRSEFDKMGVGDVYHKPSVKVAVHASLFRGGATAMTRGIIEKWRKDAGLTPSEWKSLPESKQTLERAQSIVRILTNTEILGELRELSSFLEHEWNGKVIKCPTGHEYLVTHESFASNYASYLQSYEICLVAESILGSHDEVPELEALGHFHDGALLLYPDGIELFPLLSKHLQKASEQLGLVYPQRWEVKMNIPQIETSHRVD